MTYTTEIPDDEETIDYGELIGAGALQPTRSTRS
jgi:hypothetical protein